MARDPYAKRPKQTRLGYVFAIAFLALLGFLAWVFVPLFLRGVHATRESTGGDDVRGLLHYLTEDRPPEGKTPWPPYSGRNFVLSIVADGKVDLRTPRELRIFFPREGAPSDVDVARYAEVTHEALRTRRFPRLTSLAGRRNGDADARIPDDPSAPFTPIVAWLGFDDGAIVGWSNGAVRFLDRQELGLDEDDPIRVGKDAKSPILRLLSDR